MTTKGKHRFLIGSPEWLGWPFRFLLLGNLKLCSWASGTSTQDSAGGCTLFMLQGPTGQYTGTGLAASEAHYLQSPQLKDLHTQIQSLDKRFLTCDSNDPFTGSHIRHLHIRHLWLPAVGNLVRKQQGNNLMVGSHHNMMSCIRGSHQGEG